MQLKILIADDHQIVRQGLMSILENEKNCLVIGEAEDGYEVLDFLSGNEADLVIMDINMPRMNGIECTIQISEKYTKTRVLALTMHSEELYLRKMLEAGAAGYVLKNADKDELLKAINTILQGNHYFSEEITLSVIHELTRPDQKSKKENIIQLTSREMEILELILAEHTNQEISNKLNISIRTVDAHRRNLIEKTGSRNTAGLVKYALENNLFGKIPENS